jgi:hypothetical protein
MGHVLAAAALHLHWWQHIGAAIVGLWRTAFGGLPSAQGPDQPE